MTSRDEDRTAAVAGLYAAHRGRLIAVLRGLGATSADAEEVVQEAFARLLVGWDKVGQYDEPVAWVRTVAVRLWISRQRRQTVARRALPRLAGARRPGAPEPGVERVAMAVALARLPLDQRTVLVLHYMADQSVEMLARTLELPLGTVKSRLSRGRAGLLALMTAETTDHA